jgi:putative colanic acid biosynthesis acetyltransferase WcaF
VDNPPRRTVRLEDNRRPWPREVLIRRALWEAFRWAFWLPRMFSPLRVRLLKLFGAKMGIGILVMPGVRVWMPWNLEMGDFCTLGKNTEVYNFGKVTLGSQVVVSQNVCLYTASHDFRTASMPLTWAPITIESNSWVAANAFIGPGVTIGEGCVIGACAVVRRSTPPWRIFLGNPAQDVGERTIEG